MADASDLAVAEAGPDGLDAIRGLWEELRAHHAVVSPHFSARFAAVPFETRKAALLAKAQAGALRLFLARPADAADAPPVGYCAASILPSDQKEQGGQGEIDSLYVSRAFRGQGAGHGLMRAALAWLEAAGARDVRISVVFGNEAAHPFYARFGFRPAATVLRRFAAGD